MSDLSRCWNCGQALRPDSARCLFCGVEQSKPVQYLLPPTGAVPSPVAPGVAARAVVSPPAVPTFAVQGGVSPFAAPESVRAGQPLGDAFQGNVAGAGRQVTAFTLDVLVIVVVTVVVGVLTGSPVYAGLAFVETLLGFWMLEARTGATIGSALLGLRVSKREAPFSPGGLRSAVRGLIIGTGFLAGVVGAWIAVASAAWGRGGRGWPDSAARTVVVAVAPRSERIRRLDSGANLSQVSAQPGSVDIGVAQPRPPSPTVLAAPVVVSTLARPGALVEDSLSRSQTGAPVVSSSAPVPQVAPAPQPTPADRGDQGEEEPSASDRSTGTLLLVFDTGQREQFASPVTVNLGRNPAKTEPHDVLLKVQDPESTVSKTHLRLEHSRGRTWLTDFGSTNGTDLLEDEGGVRALTEGDRVLLEDGTRVRIGNRAFTVSVIVSGES